MTPAWSAIRAVLLSLATYLHAHGAPCPDHFARLGEDSSSSAHHSIAHVSVVEGSGVNFWSRVGDPGERSELKLELSPDNPVVVGRQDGGRIPYLDPRYRSTSLVPNSGARVLRNSPVDNRLSRGHFMLKSSAHGIILLNGVPRPSGGVRPPKNGTWLISPENRPLAPGEEFLIERGNSAKIKLPNGTVILLNAE